MSAKKDIRLFWIIMLIILLSLLLLGCNKTVYVPVEKVRVEYKDRYLRDSIQVYDSIFVKEKGDTVWFEKYKYIYKDRLKTDTVCIVDSIPYIKEIPIKGDPIPYVTSWQNFQIWCGRILLLVLVSYFGIRFFKKYIGRG